MAKITKDTTVHDAIQINPAAAEILVSYGMHCLGCAMARGETISDAAAVHNANIDEMLVKLNEGVE